ncbi:hypothetical protein Tco_0077723 [Tanacetum coccineum]
METSRLASLPELNLCGTQLVVAVFIDTSLLDILNKTRTTEVFTHFSVPSYLRVVIRFFADLLDSFPTIKQKASKGYPDDSNNSKDYETIEYGYRTTA